MTTLKELGAILQQHSGGVIAEFERSVTELQALCCLVGGGGGNNEQLAEELERFHRALRRAENMMDELNTFVDSELSHLDKIDSLTDALVALKTRIDALPSTTTSSSDSASSSSSSNATTAKKPSRSFGSSQALNGENEDDNVGGRGDGDTISGLFSSQPTVSSGGGVSRISTPTPKQFEAIPRYMRGRLTYDDLKKVVCLMNSAAERKAAVLREPIAALGPRARENHRRWTNVDSSPRVRDSTFVTDGDITEEARLDDAVVDAQMIKTAVQCLRHVGHVRVVAHSQSGLQRYVFLQ